MGAPAGGILDMMFTFKTRNDPKELFLKYIPIEIIVAFKYYSCQAYYFYDIC